jgi:hypothetical protein
MAGLPFLELGQQTTKMQARRLRYENRPGALVGAAGLGDPLRFYVR